MLRRVESVRPLEPDSISQTFRPMNRAFIKEPDGGGTAEEMAERPVDVS